VYPDSGDGDKCDDGECGGGDNGCAGDDDEFGD